MGRSQRNLYVSGFALFLVFVIRRLVVLLASQATLKAESDAAMRQAKSAGEAAQRLLDEGASHSGDKKDDNKDGKDECQKLRSRLQDVTEETKQAKDKIRALENEINEVKSKAEVTSEEYNQLLLEHTKLDKRSSILGKKDD